VSRHATSAPRGCPGPNGRARRRDGRRAGTCPRVRLPGRDDGRRAGARTGQVWRPDGRYGRPRHARAGSREPVAPANGQAGSGQVCTGSLASEPSR